MSREAYSPPSLSQNTNNAAAGGGGSQTSGAFAGFNLTGGGSQTFEDTSRPVQYFCGDCDTRVALKRGDPIRCKECGYRVLYKERTNRMIQFEAR